VYVAQAGLELVILLPQFPTYWDCRCVPPGLTSYVLFCFFFYTKGTTHVDLYLGVFSLNNTA
jgi:hypothetical protein